MMFRNIYRRDDKTSHDENIARLSEEFGELAEAIRVLPVAPQYFVSEAPDVFAWLMGFANQFDFDRIAASETLEQAMERHYPGACQICRHSVCKCPPIPAQTLGRIAKEAPIKRVFPSHPGLFSPAEMIELFSDVERSLVIGAKTIPLRKEDIEILAHDVAKILEVVNSHSEAQAFLSFQIAASLGKLETLAAQGTITQESIEVLLSQIQALPSEQRSALVSFLTSLSAGALFQTILQAGHFLTGN
jgi:NTP pyrophosphatase (non-canonical NTP hydrolase)